MKKLSIGICTTLLATQVCAVEFKNYTGTEYCIKVGTISQPLPADKVVDILMEKKRMFIARHGNRNNKFKLPAPASDLATIVLRYDSDFYLYAFFEGKPGKQDYKVYPDEPYQNPA